MNPTDHQLYHHRTSCLVGLRDLDEYRRLCSQILLRFADAKDPNVAERMAKDCSILSNPGVDFKVLNGWIERALAVGKDHGDFLWFLFAKGLADYRQGQYTRAAESMQLVLQKSNSVEREIEAWMVLAMSRHRLQERQAARSSFAQGLELAETKLPKIESAELGDGWIDWSFAQGLISEARSLINHEAQ